MTIPHYDPLDYENLARSVVEKLFDQEPGPLPPPVPFGGAGVYAIYYFGDCPAYQPIAAQCPNLPIYVGEAMPPGERKGSAESPDLDSPKLYARLQEHAESIEQVDNLHLQDFQCRYLAVQPVWIHLAQRFLISYYQPLWNVTVDGFGNHDPGAGRRQGKCPNWDILHPGRRWAALLRLDATEADVLHLVAEHFRCHGDPAQ